MCRSGGGGGGGEKLHFVLCPLHNFLLGIINFLWYPSIHAG